MGLAMLPFVWNKSGSELTHTSSRMEPVEADSRRWLKGQAWTKWAGGGHEIAIPRMNETTGSLSGASLRPCPGTAVHLTCLLQACATHPAVCG